MLRRDHDIERARALLYEYLRVHPDGIVAEEALALTIEVAAAVYEPAAGQLADDYLRRFPTGRFRQMAEQARQRFPY